MSKEKEKEKSKTHKLSLKGQSDQLHLDYAYTPLGSSKVVAEFVRTPSRLRLG